MSIVLEPCKKECLNSAKRLYHTAFPAEERAPWIMLRSRADKHRAELLAAMDGDSFAGMAYTVTYKDLTYLFYLAVEENRRGQGTGSRIISALRERYPGNTIFLAREQLDRSADNYPQRESRHRFYLANGFTDMDCRIREGKVIYDVMGTGRKVLPEEYEALMLHWSGRLVRLFFSAEMTG